MRNSCGLYPLPLSPVCGTVDDLPSRRVYIRSFDSRSRAPGQDGGRLVIAVRIKLSLPGFSRRTEPGAAARAYMLFTLVVCARALARVAGETEKEIEEEGGRETVLKAEMQFTTRPESMRAL